MDMFYLIAPILTEEALFIEVITFSKGTYSVLFEKVINLSFYTEL